MIRIASGAVTAQNNIVGPATAAGRFFGFEYKNAGTFAQIKAISIVIERAARFWTHDPKGVEAAQGNTIELIGPAGNGKITETGSKPAHRGTDRVCARRTRVDYCRLWPFQSKNPGYRACEIPT